MEVLAPLWELLRDRSLTTIAAFGSLAISSYLLFRMVWSERKANIEVRYEEASLTPHFSSSMRNTDIDYRIVLVNHGPHEAKRVDLKVFRNDGQPTEAVNQVMVASDADHEQVSLTPLPIPALNPGQTYHLPFVTAIGNRPYSAILTWRDGRLRTQERNIWLSTIRS